MADESKKHGARVHGDSGRDDARGRSRSSAERQGGGRAGSLEGPGASAPGRGGPRSSPGRGSPRSAREDRPRSVGEHPGTRKNRDAQPTRRPARPQESRPTGGDRRDAEYRGSAGGERRRPQGTSRRDDRPRPDRRRPDRRDDRPRSDRRDDSYRQAGGPRGGRSGQGPGGRRSSRPGQAERAQRPFEPQLPAGITGKELDRDFHDELRGLSRETAERVARHVVAAYALEESDPQASQDHARFAARIGGRIGAVREAHGIIAYRAGDFRTAVRELRTALRITGRIDVLPLIADAERGMGRPERALDIAASDDAAELGADAAIELMIVVAGAYADTGDVETALRTLEIPALRHKVEGRWQVRLWVAYSDLLARSGRQEESTRWLTLAADADTEGLTDAAARLGRPMPQLPDLSWEDDEELSVIDAYQEDQPPRDDETVGAAREEAGADRDHEAAADAEQRESVLAATPSSTPQESL